MDPKLQPAVHGNAGSAEHIPTRRRRRLIALAAFALLVGAGAATAVWITSRGGGGGPPITFAPLKGKPLVRLRHEPPRPGSVEAAVAAAVRGYDPAQPDRAVAALQRLPQNNATVVFHLGEVQLWAGDRRAAAETFIRVERLDPCGFYGRIVDGLLFSSELPCYPPYVSATQRRGMTPARLRQAVSDHPRDAEAWVRLAASEQFSHRAAAVRAARRAVELDPTGISPRIALAVISFDKANPAATMGVLGPLSQQAPSNPELRFHMGVVLLWLRQTEDALAQFRQALADDPHGSYGSAARQFLDKLKGV
ncbi:MAG: tetratricopeptide repeat protein, partial [Gaiellales bacterium]